MKNHYLQLNLGQRYQLSNLLQVNTSKKTIAILLGVHISTVYRELARNALLKQQTANVYKAESAELFSNKRRYRKKTGKSTDVQIWRRLTFLLKCDRSPE